jgi:hypothetical protein
VRNSSTLPSREHHLDLTSTSKHCLNSGRAAVADLAHVHPEPLPCHMNTHLYAVFLLRFCAHNVCCIHMLHFWMLPC